MRIDRHALTTASEGLLATAAMGRSWEGDLDVMARAAGSHSAAVWRSKDDVPSFVGNRAFAEGAANLGRPGDPPYSEVILSFRPPRDGFAPSTIPTVATRLARLPLYQDVLVKIGFSTYAGLPLATDDGAVMRFVLWRGGREGAFSDEEIRLLETTASNIRFATLFARRNGELLARQRAASFLERDEPAFALDDGGRATPLNANADPSARALPFTIRRGRLVAASDRETRLVHNAVADAVSSPRRPGSVVVASDAGDRHQLLVMPLHGDARDVFCATRAIATIVRLDGGRLARADGGAAQYLATGFELTGREVAVALLGAEGLPPASIAARLGMGEGTARNHMKSVFRKTGVHSQAGLAAMVARYR